MTLIGLIKRSYKHYQTSLKSPLPSSSPSSSPSSFISYSLYSKHTSNFRTIILSSILVFIIFFTIFQDNTQYRIADVINYAALQEEVESANEVQLLTYKSPFDENLFKEHSRKDDTLWKLARFDLLKHQSKHTFDSKSCQNRNKYRLESYTQVWRRFDARVSSEGLWRDGVGGWLSEASEALRTACILRVDLMEEYTTRIGKSGLNDANIKAQPIDAGGGENGWMVTLEGGQKAVMRIVWEAKGEMKRGGLCDEGFEMPTSEIASFHVHKLLGFNRVHLVVGRRLNVLHDILPFSSPALARLIRVKQGLSGNETCVLGRCRSCRSQHILCPSNNQLQVSLTLALARLNTPIKSWQPIAKQTYTDRCKHNSTQANLHRHLDVFDLTIFNTLVGKPSSTTLSLLSSLGSDSGEVLATMDNARSFCDYNRELNLTPLINCCKLRKSTYDRLKSLQKEGFSKSLRQSLEEDDLNPILKNAWYPVLDERLQIIIGALDKCISNNGARNIFFSDL